MGMPAPETITTIEELLALPEDGMRHELLDGEHVVTPAPRFRHQHVLGEIWAVLREAARARTDLIVLTSPADVYLGPRTLVQPDLFIVRVEPEQLKHITWKDVPTPLLAVEILSLLQLLQEIAARNGVSIWSRASRSTGSWISMRKSSNVGKDAVEKRIP